MVLANSDLSLNKLESVKYTTPRMNLIKSVNIKAESYKFHIKHTKDFGNIAYSIDDILTVARK